MQPCCEDIDLKVLTFFPALLSTFKNDNVTKELNKYVEIKVYYNSNKAPTTHSQVRQNIAYRINTATVRE